MNITTLIAIYGAGISTILLLYRYFERRELRRNLLVEISSIVKRNPDNELIKGRRGGHFLILVFINKAKTATYVDRYFFKAYNYRLIPTAYCGFNLKFEQINIDVAFPIKLEHGEKFTITYPLTDYLGVDGSINMNKIREMAKTCKYLEGYCCDTLEKWHNGRRFNINSFCQHFDLVEQNLIE
jgi:hypothetical protein